MNEVTKIHLGRQAFTIAADAHTALRKYLDAIKKQVADNEVLSEVENRMAELLTERGINSDKVILLSDVDFLKEQLGSPKDFGDDESSHEKPAADGKRLFRDTDNAMLAGVAAGLSLYFGIDVLLVRILFIISIIAGGWGILLYIVLWLLVPEAKSSSDRLQMLGEAVTVESLKGIVERADVKGAARRANDTLSGPINNFFRIVLTIIGIAFMVVGLGLLFALVGAGTYILLHSGNLTQDNIFPVGLREHLLLYIALAVAALISLFVVLFGMAVYSRKWPISTWITGVLLGLIFIGLAGGGALAADVYPNVRDRYNSNVHTSIRYVKPFTNVNVVGDGVDINYQNSDKYYVSLNYYDHPNLGAIKTTVNNGILVIDSSQFNELRDCQNLCIPDTYNMIITVYSPNPPQINYPNKTVQVYPGSFHAYYQ